MPDLRIIEDDLWAAAQGVLGEAQSRPPERSRRPKHLLSGLVTCGTCGGAWTVRGPDRWGCSRFKEGGAAACPNNRTISTKLMEGRVLSGLRDRMLDPEAVSAYVREYHLEHARRSRELAREGGQLRGRHQDAVAKVERLVMAVANGGEEFVEIREVLAKARSERDALAEQIQHIEQLPVVELHPTIIADYRTQVADLGSISQNPEARLEAIPKLRALIDHVAVSPAADGAKGVSITVTGRLSAMLALATGEAVPVKLYVNDGAGEGIRTLDPNLGNFPRGHCSSPYVTSA
ncbi:zinc ribbon domain-containing protein [uncultured Sphingomonas sp.]|uniref:zinc ribbon domain-containing protein n=1 Tax=uncultured Sphingomonas sp. TaxID=158754 RepID=UPI0035CC8816